MSNSSDPYPPMERRLKLSRKCLQILSKANCKLQIITKSDLVVRDIDVLKKMRSMVAMTITTIDKEMARKLEPKAPSPSRRLKELVEKHGMKFACCREGFPELNSAICDGSWMLKNEQPRIC